MKFLHGCKERENNKIILKDLKLKWKTNNKIKLKIIKMIYKLIQSHLPQIKFALNIFNLNFLIVKRLI